jgi:fructose-1,6-bisphosphatase/inositol monophosphatase family enzyme
MVAGRGPEDVLELLGRAVAAVVEALEDFGGSLDGRPDARAGSGALREPGERPGQYRLDLVADRAVHEVLDPCGVGVLSEESGLERGDAAVVVVVDPVDGSTNASRGLPWYATSLCALDDDGPWVAMVTNLATGTCWHAVRGAGAWRDGVPVRPSGVRELAQAVVVLNGHAPGHLGWRQYRALGATALDLCAVADGSVDATVDFGGDALGPWDYLGAALVLREAGGELVDAQGRELVVLDPAARRSPVSAATPELLEALLAARSAAVGQR